MKQYKTYKIDHEKSVALLTKRVSKKTQKVVESVEIEPDSNDDDIFYVFTLDGDLEDDGFIINKTVLMSGEEAKDFMKTYVSKKYHETVIQCDLVDYNFIIKTETEEIEETE